MTTNDGVSVAWLEKSGGYRYLPQPSVSPTGAFAAPPPKKLPTRLASRRRWFSAISPPRKNLRRHSRPQSMRGHESFEPEKMADEASAKTIAPCSNHSLGALNHHENDPTFNDCCCTRRSRSTSWRRCSSTSLSGVFTSSWAVTSGERQREGAFIEIDPAIVVRCFIGMVMHHSLNNNLWDPSRRC